MYLWCKTVLGYIPLVNRFVKTDQPPPPDVHPQEGNSAGQPPPPAGSGKAKQRKLSPFEVLTRDSLNGDVTNFIKAMEKFKNRSNEQELAAKIKELLEGYTQEVLLRMTGFVTAIGNIGNDEGLQEKLRPLLLNQDLLITFLEKLKTLDEAQLEAELHNIRHINGCVTEMLRSTANGGLEFQPEFVAQMVTERLRIAMFVPSDNKETNYNPKCMFDFGPGRTHVELGLVPEQGYSPDYQSMGRSPV
ncbi:MAG: hypothetical protein LBB34_00485 [Holosporales bacterium]|jgi:hypothetical protein|nr:hypothetical protein [Holosporales bacterium]